MDQSFTIQSGQAGMPGGIQITPTKDADGNTLFKTDSGQTLSVQQLVNYVSASWGVNADQQLNAKIQDMQQQNQKLQEANTVLSNLRTNAPATSSGKATMASSVVQWMNQNGITPISTGSLTQDQWNQEIQVVSEKINTMNSTSQIDTIKLDQLNKNHSQIFEFMSNTNQLFSKAMLSIIGNLHN